MEIAKIQESYKFELAKMENKIMQQLQAMEEKLFGSIRGEVPLSTSAPTNETPTYIGVGDYQIEFKYKY